MTRLNIMERRLKERLVGATILVVLIVLIVPELLSGPRRPLQIPAVTGGTNETVRNVTVDLATSKATPAPDSAASALAPTESPPASEPPRSESAPPMESPPPADGDRSGQAPSTPEPRVDHGPAPSIATLTAQQPQGAPVENPSPPPTSTGVRARSKAGETAPAAQAPHPFWAVQTGSFASRANAEKQMHRLKSRENSVYLSSGGKGPGLRYRVRVGPFADRAAAERAMARLRQDGESASLVAP